MHISTSSLCALLLDSPKKLKVDIDKFQLGVDKITFKTSYNDFFLKYLSENKPCIFGSWVTKDWLSIKDWISKTKTTGGDDKYSPNFEYLKKHFSHGTVPVADCNKKYFNSQCKTEYTFEDFITYWQDYIANGYKKENPCLYLKDWHFFKIFSDYKAYEVPQYFFSDWLNEFSDSKSKSDSKNDDFRFVYMGPKGSWTPFHADVYRSFSWSANICGRKKWILYPPGAEVHLQDINGELPFDVSSPGMNEKNVYPNANKACPVILTQEAGEIIFVPSGWYHQVHNLEDTISINHNWLNACNISTVCDYLFSQYAMVEKEISDCKSLMTEKEWVEQCQIIMKANSGISLAEFFDFLEHIAYSRVAILLKHLKNISKSNFHCNCVNVPFDNKLSSKLISDQAELCKILRSFLENVRFKVDEKKSSSSINDHSVNCQFHNLKLYGLNHNLDYCVNHVIYELCMVLEVLQKNLQNHLNPMNQNYLITNLEQLHIAICDALDKFCKCQSES